ncbi:MAG TPA: hypothetical protein DHW82_09920, partial [Spirochaetia bacterium]|nr:hypothetical protein [Spirochaetia bacterium]
MGDFNQFEDFFEEEILTDQDEKFEEPKLYQVILHNDDYTTMEFVIEVLIRVFQKSFSEAEVLMRDVHIKGKGIAGVYPFDIAATKTYQVG